MTATRSGLMDLLSLVPSGGPAILNASVTNLCNATCDFCNFAHDKGFVTDRRSMDATRFAESLALMKAQANVRFVTFMGGEPLLHQRGNRLPGLAAVEQDESHQQMRFAAPRIGHQRLAQVFLRLLGAAPLQ